MGDSSPRGCYGRVYEHGAKRVYKEAYLDGTALWLERCFAIQKRLGLDHPLCRYMPEIFSFKRTGPKRYTAVMAKYRKIDALDVCPDPDGFPGYELRAFVDAVMCTSGEYGYSHADDMHRGNILWCDKRGWIITDPSCSSYKEAAKSTIDPKFIRAKRVCHAVRSAAPPVTGYCADALILNASQDYRKWLCYGGTAQCLGRMATVNGPKAVRTPPWALRCVPNADL